MEAFMKTKKDFFSSLAIAIAIITPLLTYAYKRGKKDEKTEEIQRKFDRLENCKSYLYMRHTPNPRVLFQESYHYRKFR